MNKMRRLPGPACCRLSEGDHPPEALYELFRDWQRTHTQSSVKALRSPRLQMDVWFCRAQEPMPRGTLLRVEHPELLICTLSRACPGHPCLHLTNDYMEVGKPEVMRLLPECSSIQAQFLRAVPSRFLCAKRGDIVVNCVAGCGHKMAVRSRWQFRDYAT